MELNIDSELCIKCGECVKDCPYRILEMVDGYPAVNSEREEQCIGCQHCFAICKPGALSIFGLNPEKSLPLKGGFPEADKMKTLMMGRRSVRRYRQEPVDSELLADIFETVRMAPTGMNRRTTVLTVVDDLSVMDELRTRTYRGLRQAIEDGNLPDDMSFFEGFSKAYEENGIDVLFRGAPHFLVTSAPKDNRSGVTDGIIALSYFELLAASNGLGAVWDGLAKWALIAVAPEALELLGLPDNHEPVYAMAFGRPAVKYHRTVQRPGGAVRKVRL